MARATRVMGRRVVRRLLLQLRRRRPSRGKGHKFVVRSFYSPTKCDVCNLPLLGLMRQGIVCDDCGYNCHSACAGGAFPRCPTPANQKGLQLRDPLQPSGVVMEGFLRVPRPGGVRKGWRRHFVVLTGARMLLFNGEDQKQGQEIVSSIDLRAPDFRVENVTPADVIHANRKEIPMIFRVVYSTETSKRQIFFQADNEPGKVTWLTTIARVANAAAKTAEEQTFACRPLFDSASCGESLGAVLRTITCMARTDRFLLLGSEEGLSCIKLAGGSGVARFGEGKRVSQMEVLAAEKLLVLITGKSRQLRVLQLAAFEADGGSLAPALDETKGCTFFATGTYQKVTCIAVAMKRKLLLYNARSLKKLKEIPVPEGCTGVFFFDDGLCVALSGKFLLIDGHSSDPKKLLDPNDASTNFVFNQAQEMVPMAAFQLASDVLLCFNYIGLFVNKDGRRARDAELKWTSVPAHIAYCEPYVLAYAADYIDVFDVRSCELVQTLSLPGGLPLCRDGSLSLSTDLEVVTVVLVREASAPELPLPADLIRSNSSSADRPKLKRRTSAELRISISQPMNFQHVAHAGTSADVTPTASPAATMRKSFEGGLTPGAAAASMRRAGGPPPPEGGVSPVTATRRSSADAAPALAAASTPSGARPSAESPAPSSTPSAAPAQAKPTASPVAATPVAAPAAAPTTL
eukprot:Opistho-1_new@81508